MFLGLIGVLIQFLFFEFHIENPQAVALFYIVVSTFFLSTTHIAYSVVMYRDLPEFQKAMAAKFGSKSRFLMRIFLVFGLCFLLFLLGQGIFLTENWTRASVLFFCTYAFFDSLLVFHSLRQTLGLSLQIGHKTKESPTFDDHGKMEKLEVLEKKIVVSLILVDILIKAFWILQIAEIVKLKINPSMWGMIVMAPIVALLVLLAFATRSKEKTLFSLRYLLRPFVYLSPASSLALLAVHGLEYHQVSRKLIQRSSMPKSRTSKVWASLIGLMVLTAFLGLLEAKSLTGYFYSVSPSALNFEVPALFRAGNALLWALVVTHIYFDSVAFRMKDPNVRNHIGPLLR